MDAHVLICNIIACSLCMCMHGYACRRPSLRIWADDEVARSQEAEPQLPQAPLADAFARLLTGSYARAQVG